MPQPRGRPPKALEPDTSIAAWLGAEIRARRQARGLTLKDLARLTGYSVQHLSEAELAKAPVSTRCVTACDQALNARGRLLALLPAMVYERAMQREQRAEARQSDTTLPPGMPIAVRSTQPQAEDDDVKRRTFLGLGLAALLPPLDGLEGEPREIGADVEEWERTVHAYAHDMSATPAGELLPGLAADFRELSGLLDGKLATRDRQRLVGVTGQLSTLTAELVTATGKPHAARQWWRRARQAATVTGDDRQLAFTCGQQAVSGLYGGYPPAQVLDIAREARAATRAPCPGAMKGLSSGAQALAILGREREARAALSDLARMFDRLPDDVTEDRSALGWPEHRLSHTESYVYMHVGDMRRGEDARERALAEYQSSAWRGPTQVRLHRAASLIADGHVSEGAQYATEALEPLGAPQRSDRFVSLMADRTLAVIPDRARHLPAVAEYREMLATA